MTFEFEGLGRRSLAALIDNATWFIGGLWLLSFVPRSTIEDHPEVIGFGLLVLLSAWFNYFAFCEWRWGQTIGKSAIGMKVISLDRGKISYGQASIRNVLRLVDFFVIGEVMIATDERRQRLGDKAAGTVVVRDSSRKRGAKHYSAEPHRVAERENAPVAAEAKGSAGPAGAGGTPSVGWNLSQTAWGLIGGLALGGVFLPLLVLPFDPHLESDAAVLVAQAMFAGSLIFVAVGVASSWKFSPLSAALSQLGLRRVRLSGFGIALLTLFVYYCGAALFAYLVIKPDQQDVGGELGVDNPSVIVAVSAVLLIVVAAPFSEEIFFRGLVFGGLRKRFELWPAALISGVIFGIPHILTGPTAAIPLAGLGVALAWLYDRTGSIWPCIFIHMINNAIALAAAS